MTLSQEIGDLVGYRTQNLRTCCLEHQGAEGEITGQPPHCDGVRHQQYVILVTTPHVRALGGEHTDDAEWSTFHADDLPDGLFISEQDFGSGLANQSHFIGVADISFGEILSRRARPGTDVDILRPYAHDLRIDVLVAGRQLREIPYLRADPVDAGDLLAD